MNNLIIIGYLGRDPEFTETASGTKLCKMSIAVTEKIKGEDSTTWFNVVAFGQRAENCQRGLTKGSRVCIRGPIRSRRYTDKNGNDRTDWSVSVDYIEFLSSPNREARATQAQQRPQPQMQPAQTSPWGASQPTNWGASQPTNWGQPQAVPQVSTFQTGWDTYQQNQSQQNQVVTPPTSSEDVPF